MIGKGGLKYRPYTSKRPLMRRSCLLSSRCATLETLFGSEQEVGDTMEQAARSNSHGEAFPDRREHVSRVFRTASRSRKNAVKIKAELNAEMETRLREANENLVVASVNAQVMTEAIEKILVHLSHMAEHDLLTGLPNRALLTDRLVQSISLAKRHGNKLALMFPTTPLPTTTTPCSSRRQPRYVLLLHA